MQRFLTDLKPKSIMDSVRLGEKKTKNREELLESFRGDKPDCFVASTSNARLPRGRLIIEGLGGGGGRNQLKVMRDKNVQRNLKKEGKTETQSKVISQRHRLHGLIFKHVVVQKVHY